MDDGKLDQTKGTIEEAAGDLTDNKDLKKKGRADQMSGRLKEKVENAKDWVEDKIDDIKK